MDYSSKLPSLKGGHFASDALNQTQFKAPKSNFSSNFESYSRVQRLVDKVIKDTVYSLEKDLNVLPEKLHSDFSTNISSLILDNKQIMLLIDYLHFIYQNSNSKNNKRNKNKMKIIMFLVAAL